MATYKLYKKTSATAKEEIQIPASSVSGLAKVATSGSYNDLSNKPTIPSAVTSIDGLGGGTLTSPIKLTGGDGAAASKMILTSDGQITDTGTSTLFGFSGGNLIVGHGNYPLTMRGKQARPTWNGKDLALKSDIPDVSGKQDKLTAGSNITISGNTISATVPTDYVKYTAQTLTDAQKSQARSNIGAGTSSFSGSYNDLLDKPSFDKLTRIQKQAYTGGDNTVQYFKLASFPVYNSGENYASFIITGRMGGWQSDNMSFVNMILYNRNGEGGGYINVANSAFFNLCDIVMYREEDGTSTAYLKVKGYYTFDININTYQAVNVYTGTDDTPTGTLKWTASEQADRLAVSGGVAYVNGFTLPKQVEINGTVVNPNSAGLVNLGTGFAKTADLPIKSATLSGTTLTITL